MGKQQVWSTISIVASLNKMPEESKQAERSIVLAKQLQLEAIGVDWQRKLNQSSKANLDPS